MFKLVFKNYDNSQETKIVECSHWVTSQGDIYAWTEEGSVCIKKSSDWYLFEVK